MLFLQFWKHMSRWCFTLISNEWTEFFIILSSLLVNEFSLQDFWIDTFLGHLHCIHHVIIETTLKTIGKHKADNAMAMEYSNFLVINQSLVRLEVQY